MLKDKIIMMMITMTMVLIMKMITMRKTITVTKIISKLAHKIYNLFPYHILV